ncbi:MAG TPA: TIM barrel protein [Opitutaceae bacterium]|nr:TIM barrel protein [Opitutaceae bacterium]
MYRRSISTLGCPDFSLEQCLAFAERQALDAVEVRVLNDSIDLPAVLATTYGTPSALAERMRNSPVPIVSLDTSLTLVGNTADDRNEFLRFIPWAEAAGARWLRVFDGGETADPAVHRTMAETIAWWRAERSAHRWRPDIMVETHDALSTTASLHALRAVAPGTAILWDTHHTWKVGGEDPATTWDAIRRDVVHIHVKDSVDRPGPKHPFTYVLPGHGEFPMAALRPRLQAEFTGCVSLEWERKWHPELAPLEDALTAATRSKWW